MTAAYEKLQALHGERGFTVFACNYPHDIGEEIHSEDRFIEEEELGVRLRWFVIGTSNRDEGADQGMKDWALDRPFFYRAEAIE